MKSHHSMILVCLSSLSNQNFQKETARARSLSKDNDLKNAAQFARVCPKQLYLSPHVGYHNEMHGVDTCNEFG